MSKKRKTRFSGVTGQPHIEGIMMRNCNKYAVVARKSDRVVETVVKDVENNPNKVIRVIPFARGFFALIQDIILGIEAMEFTANVYSHIDGELTGIDKLLHKLFGKHADVLVVALTVFFSFFVFACSYVGLPFIADMLLKNYILNTSVIFIAEGLLKLLILVVYLFIISRFKEIKRFCGYHGAEHKCINCIEKGRKLTIKNVRDQSRFQKRCSSNFIWIVMIITVIFFVFFRIESTPIRILARIISVPIIASVTYEYLRLISKFDNIVTKIMAFPVTALQVFTTREPDEEMIEVSIKALEAVFDWRSFLVQEFPDYYSAYDFGLDEFKEKKKLTKKEEIQALRARSKKYHEQHKLEKEEAKNIKEAQREAAREEHRKLREEKNLDRKKRAIAAQKEIAVADNIEDILNTQDDVSEVAYSSEQLMDIEKELELVEELQLENLSGEAEYESTIVDEEAEYYEGVEYEEDSADSDIQYIKDDETLEEIEDTKETYETESEEPEAEVTIEETLEEIEDTKDIYEAESEEPEDEATIEEILEEIEDTEGTYEAESEEPEDEVTIEEALEEIEDKEEAYEAESEEPEDEVTTEETFEEIEDTEETYEAESEELADESTIEETIEETEETYAEELEEDPDEIYLEETIEDEYSDYEEEGETLSEGRLKPVDDDDFGFDPEDEEVPVTTMRFEPVDESMLETETEDDEEDGPLFNKDIVSIPMPEKLSTFEVLPEGGIVSRIYNYDEEEVDNVVLDDEDIDFDNIIDEHGRLTLKDTDAFNRKLDEEFEAIMRSLGLEDDL